VNEEEVEALLRRERATHLEVRLFVAVALSFVCNDLDGAAAAHCSLITLEKLLKCLVGRSDHLMDRKLDRAGQVVPIEIVEIVEVVNVVDSDLVVLALLEVIGHFEVLDPLGVEAVHDDLRLAKLLPHVALLFEEHAHAVRPGERVQVWQVVALEREGHEIDEALVLGNAAVGGGKDGVVQVTAHSKPSCP